MAITAQNAAYLTGAPVANGSTTLAFGGSSLQEFSYLGTVTFTGDGATTTATLNYIDGSAALGFTPSAIIGVRAGGNTTATISVVSVVDAANANKTATVQFSAAPTNGGTITVAFFVLK